MHKCYHCDLPCFNLDESVAYVGPTCQCWNRPIPFALSPPDAAKCQPAVPLTEEDVRRIVRDELAKGGA